MEECTEKSNHEMDDLKQEIERFQKEKERVRSIVGEIGGVPRTYAKVFNIIFIILIIVILIISLFSGGTVRLAMVELAVTALSIKLIYLIHNQSRVNHFQLWILSSLEWRLNELCKEIKNQKH